LRAYLGKASNDLQAVLAGINACSRAAFIPITDHRALIGAAVSLHLSHFEGINMAASGYPQAADMLLHP